MRIIANLGVLISVVVISRLGTTPVRMYIIHNHRQVLPFRGSGFSIKNIVGHRSSGLVRSFALLSRKRLGIH